MSGGSPSDRFRLRLEDGSEVVVSSVEALARRVQRGDLVPDTPLFDGSTGVWIRAADAPVVRFILEDIAVEGGVLPPEWEPTGEWGAEPPSGTSEIDIEARLDASLGESDPAASSDDPFDFGITLVPPAPEDPVEGGYGEVTIEPPPAEGPEQTAAEPPSKPPPAESDWRARSKRESERWLTHPEMDELRPAPGPTAADVHAGPGGVVPPPTYSGGEAAPWDDVPIRRETEAPVAATGESRGFRRPLALVLVGGLALAAAVTFLGDREGDSDLTDFPASGERPDGGAAVVSIYAAAEAQPPPPSDLRETVDTALAAFAARIEATIDSLRTVHDVGGAPPPQWLGGPYLADAGSFPEVRRFWEAYAGLVEDLRMRDRSVFLEVMEEAVSTREASPDEVLRLEVYLEGRYERMSPSREDRSTQLLEAAASAIALHDFLVGAAPQLRFTPAVGASVPRDPVLEVGTDDPAVLNALNDHLDALFGALDRSRGGGALSQGGLRSDLFLGFGVL